MRQINLLPTVKGNAEKAPIHSFWKRFGILAAIVLIASVGLAWVLRIGLADLEEQIRLAEIRRKAMEPELKQFQDLANQRNALRTDLQKINEEIDKDFSLNLLADLNICPIVEQITLSIPEQVWLKSLECKVEDRRLLLEATATSEQQMKEFVLGNLQNRYGENAVTLDSIQRGRGSPPTVQFDVTIHLPTETVTVALPKGEGI